MHPLLDSPVIFKAKRLVACLGLLFAPMLWAFQDAPSAPVIQAVLEDLDGISRQVSLGELRGKGLGDAVFLRFEGVAGLALEPGAELCEVELAGGDRIAGTVAGLDEEHLGLSMVADVKARISIDHLLALRFPERLARADQEFTAPEEGDRLYRVLPRGIDKVEGLLVGFSPEGVLFESRLGERTYPWEDVAALFVEPLGDEPGDEPGDADGKAVQPVVLDLVGGNRISVNLEGFSADSVRVGGRLGKLNVPFGAVRELLVDNGRYAFLGWLPVADTGPVASPFDPPGAEPLGMVWRHRIGSSVGGGPLRAEGRDWTRGIGVHAPSRLTWELAGEFASLRILAAVEDPARRGQVAGSVRFRVIADGKQLFESGVVRAGEAVLRLPSLSLAGVQQLVLEVDDAGDGPVMDRANWLRPILVRP